MSNNSKFTSDEGVSLKEYINDKLSNLEKSIDMRFQSVNMTTNSALASADKATLKAETAVEKRLEGLNELRSMALDQQRTFIPRAETDIINKSITDRLDKIENKITAIDGKEVGLSQGWGWAVGVIGIIATIIAVIFRFT
jgi:hypothetical protein